MNRHYQISDASGPVEVWDGETAEDAVESFARVTGCARIGLTAEQCAQPVRLVGAVVEYTVLAATIDIGGKDVTATLSHGILRVTPDVLPERDAPRREMLAEIRTLLIDGNGASND